MSIDAVVMFAVMRDDPFVRARYAGGLEKFRKARALTGS
jgi:hypothetical protein